MNITKYSGATIKHFIECIFVNAFIEQRQPHNVSLGNINHEKNCCIVSNWLLKSFDMIEHDMILEKL